jgi:hypothetical protein
LKGGRKNVFPPVLKIPRQCQLVFLGVGLRKDEALESVKVKFRT